MVRAIYEASLYVVLGVAFWGLKRAEGGVRAMRRRLRRSVRRKPRRASRRVTETARKKGPAESMKTAAQRRRTATGV